MSSKLECIIDWEYASERAGGIHAVLSGGGHCSIDPGPVSRTDSVNPSDVVSPASGGTRPGIVFSVWFRKFADSRRRADLLADRVCLLSFGLLLLLLRLGNRDAEGDVSCSAWPFARSTLGLWNRLKSEDLEDDFCDFRAGVGWGAKRVLGEAMILGGASLVADPTLE